MSLSIAKPLPWQRVHFTGIGGVGMSGLAHILLDWGCAVSGTDEKDSAALDTLRARGAAIDVGHAAGHVAGAGLLVRSSAVPEQNPEVVEARRAGLAVVRRGDFLADLATHFDTVVAIAGSHGKTTTTAMLAHLLRSAGLSPGFLVGGDVTGWLRSAGAGDGTILVTEVDESDGTQAALHSDLALITNVEDDHCWSLGGVQQLEACFRRFAEAAETVIAWTDAKTTRLFSDLATVHWLTTDDIRPDLCVPMGGIHNRCNAMLALRAATRLGVPVADALAALRRFPGVARRLTERYRSPDSRLVVVEDYAHHPTELHATLQTLREQHPLQALVTVFQPHRFERIRRYAKQFGEALGSGSDRAVIVRPFGAWCDDQHLADPRDILAAVGETPAEYWQGDLTELGKTLGGELRAIERGAVAAVIGAGDVCEVIAPLRNHLTSADLAELGEQLCQCPDTDISVNTPWSALTTLGIGRACPLLIRPRAVEAVQGGLALLSAHNVPILPLGTGSNVAGTDDAEFQAALQLCSADFTRCDIGAGAATVGAGVPLQRAVRALARAGVLPEGLAALAWIPGTVGGAVAMNAGADGAEMALYVESVEGVDPAGDLWHADGSAMPWRYRCGGVPEGVVVTCVRLRLGKMTPERALSAIEAAGRARLARQPRGHSAGSVFRNPKGDSAGRLLDAAGCKGHQIGCCSISSKHANFILAESGAAESDFVDLLLDAQRRVYHRTGVVLDPEVELVGSVSAQRVWRQTALLREAQ